MKTETIEHLLGKVDMEGEASTALITNLLTIFINMQSDIDDLKEQLAASGGEERISEIKLQDVDIRVDPDITYKHLTFHCDNGDIFFDRDNARELVTFLVKAIDQTEGEGVTWK